MQIGGFPLEPLGPDPPMVTPASVSSNPAAPPAAADMVDLASAPPPSRPDFTGLLASHLADPAAQGSPRPWPRAVVDLPAASAWPVLASRGPAEVAAGLLAHGAVGAALLPTLEEQLKKAPHQPRGAWDGQATPKGWRVPRNPSRTPVRPKCAFDVVEGTDDLGPLRLVSTMVGRIRALRLQWPEEYQEPACGAQKAVLHDVLTRLAPDVVVHVVAEGVSERSVRALVAEWAIPRPERVHVHALQLHSTPEQLVHPLTMWARDGAVLMRTEDGRDVLLLPRSFRGDTQVSSSLNRRIVQATGAAPARLASALPDLIVRRSRLTFEGGDMVSSRHTLLLGRDTVQANRDASRVSDASVVERFAQEMARDVIVVDPQPEFHIDLGFTFLDDGTVAVANPGESARVARGLSDELTRLAALTEEKGLAAKYDRAADMLRAQGFRVVRLPNLAGLGLCTPYMTYNNVLMENYTVSGECVKRVFMPVYGVPALDDAARACYREHGFEVVDMPSARLSTLLWGAIRCATGELQVTDGD